MKDVGPPAKHYTLSAHQSRMASCEGKQAFVSVHRAREVARRKKGERRIVYRCAHCGKYHIGHPPPRLPRPKSSDRGRHTTDG